MNSIKVVGIVAIIVFCFMYFIVNENLRKEIIAVLNLKIKKVKIKDIFVILILFIIIMYSLKVFLNTKRDLKFIMENYNNRDEIDEEAQKTLDIQHKRYKELFDSIETNIENCKNPYIPEDFAYVEGEWNSGFVIEDKNGNQFVWVPCTNIENEEKIPLLRKKRFIDSNVIYFNCYEKDDYEEFLISSLENGGFYISRFEIGNENGIPVSKKDSKIWTNIKQEKAETLSENMYENINSKLINGYAFDTAISFIFDEIDLKNIPETTNISGTKSYKNIYDLVDDMNEMTSELRNCSKLYRGSVLNDGKADFFADRFANDTKMDNLGFRTIIYK